MKSNSRQQYQNWRTAKKEARRNIANGNVPQRNY